MLTSTLLDHTIVHSNLHSQWYRQTFTVLNIFIDIRHFEVWVWGKIVSHFVLTLHFLDHQ